MCLLVLVKCLPRYININIVECKLGSHKASGQENQYKYKHSGM